MVIGVSLHFSEVRKYSRIDEMKEMEMPAKVAGC
jgi:hypothetical protein